MLLDLLIFCLPALMPCLYIGIVLLANYLVKEKSTLSEIKLCSCGQPAINEKTAILVKGFERFLTKSILCPKCAEDYMNQHATICNTCKEPILIGEPVGVAPNNADHPFTHLTQECSPLPGLFCGQWGEGELTCSF